MEPSHFDVVAFLRALQHSGARALLIGRRALVLLGIASKIFCTPWWSIKVGSWALL